MKISLSRRNTTRTEIHHANHKMKSTPNRTSRTRLSPTVPPRVAPATFQLEETGTNGSRFHAQSACTRLAERRLRPVKIPPSRTSTTPGLTWGYMESAAGPESPGWHQGGTDSVRRPWHGMD